MEKNSQRLLVYLSLLLNISVLSAQWTTIGVQGFTGNSAHHLVLTLDHSAVPYVSYRGKFGGASLLRYTGSSWDSVGTEILSSGAAKHPTVVFRLSDNLPCVGYMDQTREGKGTVRRFDGNQWVNIGIPGFTPSSAAFPSLAIQPVTDDLYFAFRDGANQNRLSVMKFNGAAWVYVGTPGFSAPGASYDGVLDPHIFFSPEGTPFVAFCDVALGWSASVMKFNGTNWEYVGPASVSPGEVGSTAAVSANDGQIYLAFSDATAGGKISVMKFNGSIWEYVGSPNFSGGASSYCSIALDAQNNPFVAFEDYGMFRKAVVKKFNGTSWLALGAPSISDSTALYTTIAINGKGDLYAAFLDESVNAYATVQKYLGAGAVSISEKENSFNCLISPNPCNGIFSLTLDGAGDKQIQVSVSNPLGKNFYQHTLENNQSTHEIDIGKQPPGVYLVEVKAGNQRATRKLVVQ